MSRKASEDEARALLTVPFALTRGVRHPKSGLRRLRIGEADGRRTWTFDLVTNVRTTDSSGGMIADNYSAAVVELPRRIDGRIVLARKGFLRTPARSDLPEVPAGSEDLRRRFKVRASSPELAQRVLDARVCEWLAGRGRGFHYELVHDRALAYGWRRYIGGRGPLKAAVGLAEHLTLPT